MLHSLSMSHHCSFHVLTMNSERWPKFELIFHNNFPTNTISLRHATLCCNTWMRFSSQCFWSLHEHCSKLEWKTFEFTSVTLRGTLSPLLERKGDLECRSLWIVMRPFEVHWILFESSMRWIECMWSLCVHASSDLIASKWSQLSFRLKVASERSPFASNDSGRYPFEALLAHTWKH